MFKNSLKWLSIENKRKGVNEDRGGSEISLVAFCIFSHVTILPNFNLIIL